MEPRDPSGLLKNFTESGRSARQETFRICQSILSLPSLSFRLAFLSTDSSILRMFSQTREKQRKRKALFGANSSAQPLHERKRRPSKTKKKSVMRENRTYTVQQKGCAERIAPIGTLSQNGYGESLRLYSGSYLTTNTSAVSGTISRTKSKSHRNTTKRSML